MKKYILLICICLAYQVSFSQNKKEIKDSLELREILQEVIIIGKKKGEIDAKKYHKPLSTIDEFLEKSSKINMIKRGNYAWEPSINNMLSDRISVTIDGMQIFGACTDKMDPITSYVDISNLEKVAVFSGQKGNENGQTIGGAIDLKLDKTNFTTLGSSLITGFDFGYESNSNTKIFGVEANYSNQKFFINTDFIQRTASNYFDGNNQEVFFSQYNKYNFSGVAAYKISAKEKVTTSLIFDKATDVGYPALPMDVSLAKALIGYVSYDYENNNTYIKHVEAKLYANTITHVMDDTKRPNVPIHMDMPGWSDTYGFYIKTKFEKKAHHFLVNLNAYYNKSLAEMTMYPANSTEKIMFMLTWPDVRTFYSGIFAEDHIAINSKTSVQLSARVGFQKAEIASDFGLGSLQIFYPNLTARKNRFLPSITAQITHKNNHFTFVNSIGYGERAPSVSEGYGNFLYNSFDNFDYIGNPNLKNEKSVEFNSKTTFANKKISITFDNSIFYLTDYIIGKIHPNFSPMVIGANGVKVYSSLEKAIQFNSSLNINYALNTFITINGGLTYNYGKENDGENLPLIAPLGYHANINYTQGFFSANLAMKGAGDQINYSQIYGEDKTENYTIFNIDAGYNFYINNDALNVKIGIDNIFNSFYSTYSDWNNIPRMGRNIFVNLSYILK